MVVGRDPVAGWTEAVAVEARANVVAVAEHQERGTVPAFLEALIKLVEVHHLCTTSAFGSVGQLCRS